MNTFTCKQFSVSQDGVAMRVNTDGMLLGAWVNLPNHTDTLSVLDIGTGGGIIALMLAQRLNTLHTSSHFVIDALEPHPSSAQTASVNFKASQWANHLHLFSCNLQDYTSQHGAYFSHVPYNLIISNPPYFEDSLLSPYGDRSMVRHTVSLTPADLLQNVIRLLDRDGLFCVILPKTQQASFCTKATEHGLFLCRETTLYSIAGRPPKRVLMEFSKKRKALQSDTLTIHNSDGKSFTEEYKKVTGDFYLAF